MSNRPAVNDIGLEDPASAPAAGSASPVRQDSGDIGDVQMPQVQEQAPVPPANNNQENSDPNRGVENQAENPAPAEEKAKAITKTTNYIDKNNFVAQHRSNLLTMADWHQLEQQHLAPIKSGSGIIGKTKINLAAEKKKILEQRKEQKPLPEDDMLINLLKEDGCFVDSAILFKNKDINIQKLEERLLNSGQKVYFKINGELKINNDLLAEELTRPADLAFEQTDAFQTVLNNSIVTDRLNSFKKRYYRIDIIIGKMFLKKYAQLFSAEDQMMVELKFLCKDYDRRCDMALLPFYMDRLEFLRDELDNKQEKGNMAEVKFLETMIQNIENELEKEKAYLKVKSQEIYDLWLKIKGEREETKVTNTFYKLKVYQGPDDMDVLYNLQKQNDEGELHPGTLRRKQTTQKTQVQCILRIDDVEVARTNKAPINWPSYEVDILDQFQIHVFTLPSKIQLDVEINNTLVDRIDLDVPGNHVKSLTSASRLLKEYEFGKRRFHINAMKLKGNPDLGKDEKLMTPTEKAYYDKQEPIMAKNDLDGTIFVKAEWEGFGEQMPPARSETLICSAQNEKNRRHFSKMEQHQMLKEQKPLDVNDPRNELLLKEMSKMKNNYLDQLLLQDSKFQLHDIESFRHQLMEARKKDPSYASVTIPQLGSELVNGDISKFYLEWLEDVHRKEAYKQYLDKKQEAEETTADANSANITEDRLFDIATLKRRQEIYEKINTRRKQAQNDVSSSKQVQYDSIIDEVQLAPDRSIFATLKAAFTFQRKLKPKIRAKPAVSVDAVGEAKLLINVLRATDVPVRHSYYKDFIEYIKNIKDTGANQQKAFQNLYFLKQVEPYIEVRLVDPETGTEQIDRTSCAEGQCPEWNQMLEFALKATKGKFFTQGELEQNRMIIYITLFDKETIEERISKNRVIRYEENKYLGQIKIPLTTILSGSKFEGLVRIQRPLVLQNYHVVKDDLSFMNKEDFERSQKRCEEQVPTYLNLTISLDPFINIPLENEREFYVGAENGPFLEKGTAWEKQFYERFKPNARQVKAFLENIEGKSTFIPRFLSPIKPPASVCAADDKKAIERCARFVSLIPYVDDSQLFKDMPDLTCNSQEFLDLGQGDSEEHAMLLCNYFNYIDFENGRQKKNSSDSGKPWNSKEDLHSYIVYGEAVPDGFCWFVARRCNMTGSCEIWNPMNAECYNFDRVKSETKQVFGTQQTSTLTMKLFDPICTMKKVWCVVGQENVWANIQEFESPVLIDFDFHDKALWQPFLTKSLHNEHFGENVKVQSQHRQVNAPNVKYTAPRSNLYKLEEQIKKFITGKFEDERIKQVKKTTGWNLELGSQLQQVLSADGQLEDEYAGLVQDQMDPRNVKKSKNSDRNRNQNFGAREDFNPMKIPYEKYFVDKTFRHILCDFEDYMACARIGGTNSAALAPEAKDADEDIRATIVQNFLKQISGRFQKSCWAVPLNCTLTSMDNLWEMVKNTRIHEIDNQEIEFSLSVMLKPYPCNVVSVWIYIAAFRNGDDLEEEDL